MGLQAALHSVLDSKEKLLARSLRQADSHGGELTR